LNINIKDRAGTTRIQAREDAACVVESHDSAGDASMKREKFLGMGALESKDFLDPW